MTTKLKAYLWKPEKDDDSCIAIIAESVKEAKRMGWSYWGSEYGNDYQFHEQRYNLLKEKKYGRINIEGLSKGPVVDVLEGLKRGLYGYAEYTDCPRCGVDESLLHWDEEKQQYYCSYCEDKDKCIKCNKYHYEDEKCEE